eukprot:13931797-Alexandrium_andersonii.AAC.1
MRRGQQPLDPHQRPSAAPPRRPSGDDIPSCPGVPMRWAGRQPPGRLQGERRRPPAPSGRAAARQEQQARAVRPARATRWGGKTKNWRALPADHPGVMAAARVGAAVPEEPCEERQ